MDNIKRVIKYQIDDIKIVLSIFLGIILALNIISFLLYLKFNNLYFGIKANQGVSIAAGNFVSIFILFIVYNYVMYYESFPIAISFSITRKNFYKSIILNNISIALIIALFQGISFKIEPYIIRNIGMVPIQNFAMFNTETDSLFYIVLMMFLIFLVFVSLWNPVAVLNYKFGYKLWIVLVSIFIIGFLILGFNIFYLLSEIFSASWLNYKTNLFSIMSLVLSSVICYVISYFVILKTNVKHRAG